MSLSGRALIHQDPSDWEGKTVKAIKRVAEDGGYGECGLIMTHGVRIEFTDGTTLVLKTDWRGRDCYISQYGEGEE